VVGERPTIDPTRPPAEFDALVDWFEAYCYRLVLLEEYPLRGVRETIHHAQAAVAAHMRVPIMPTPPRAGRGLEELRRVLVSDHAWFLGSADQLGWFLSIVEQEDHGGHRQALGQYGRILAEAIRRHRAEERRYLAEAARKQ